MLGRMAQRVKTHRASAQRRRTALLEAAAELSAEVGAGAVTHRAVAARAGVPLSTTSYFFSSIDELVTEALRLGATERSERFGIIDHASERAAEACIDTVLGEAVDAAMAGDRAASGSQIEFYLAAGRDDDVRAEATEMLEGQSSLIRSELERNGAPQAAAVAVAMTDLTDGALLHRVGELEVDHRARLATSLRLLAAAAMLRDEEITELLGRYDLPVDPSGAAFQAVLDGPAAGAVADEQAAADPS